MKLSDLMVKIYKRLNEIVPIRNGLHRLALIINGGLADSFCNQLDVFYQ